MDLQTATNSGGGGAADAGDDGSLKSLISQLELSIEARRETHLSLIASLQSRFPDLVPSLDASLRVLSAFNGRPFVPTPTPKIPCPNPSPTLRRRHVGEAAAAGGGGGGGGAAGGGVERNVRLKTQPETPRSSKDRIGVVRSMLATVLLDIVPFSETDAAALLRKLEGDKFSFSADEKAALNDLAEDMGSGVAAVEAALKKIAEENGGIQLEELAVSGKSVLMVWSLDRSKLLKELPEQAWANHQLVAVTSQQAQPSTSSQDTDVIRMPSQPGDMWLGPPNGMFQRGPGMIGMPRMGLHPLQRPLVGFPGAMIGGALLKPKSEADELKDLEALLSKKTYREKQKSKTGEELLDLIHRPTAKETAVAAKFKSKGGSQLKEYCTNLTKEDCRRQTGSYVACEKVHFRRIIAPHTDTNLGDCSFLDTCRHTKTCKYVHYELDQTPDMTPAMMGIANLPPKPIKTQRAHYCSEVELGQPQWINCDIRNFRMDILGQFGVIMADPPWDIHMELPYGTMGDNEMRDLNVPALQTDGLIFLWVTGRAMELGRECLELWGYKRVEEIIWVKTNQLQRIIRTGRTGHWLNHSKEHCLVGIKGNPEINRNIDTDVIVAEVRETSRKPDEMYPLLERISPRTRKLELFARMHNTHAGWLSLGNQLNGVRLVDEGLRGRYKAAYPENEVQPLSPPRTSDPMDVDAGAELKTPPPAGASQLVEPSNAAPLSSDSKAAGVKIEKGGSSS